MRIPRLTLGLLTALVFMNAAAAEETQQGDNSYLPPAALRAAPGTVSARTPQPASIDSRRSVRSINAVRRHHEPRAFRGRRFAGRRLFFGIF
jgi:hypothetical protein